MISHLAHRRLCLQLNNSPISRSRINPARQVCTNDSISNARSRNLSAAEFVLSTFRPSTSLFLHRPRPLPVRSFSIRTSVLVLLHLLFLARSPMRFVSLFPPFFASTFIHSSIFCPRTRGQAQGHRYGAEAGRAISKAEGGAAEGVRIAVRHTVRRAVHRLPASAPVHVLPGTHKRPLASPFERETRTGAYLRVLSTPGPASAARVRASRGYGTFKRLDYIAVRPTRKSGSVVSIPSVSARRNVRSCLSYQTHRNWYNRDPFVFLLFVGPLPSSSQSHPRRLPLNECFRLRPKRFVCRRLRASRHILDADR